MSYLFKTFNWYWFNEKLIVFFCFDCLINKIIITYYFYREDLINKNEYIVKFFFEIIKIKIDL